MVSYNIHHKFYDGFLYTHKIWFIKRSHMPGEDKSEGTGMKTIGLLAIGLIAGIIIGVLVGAFALPQTQSQTSGISRATELKPEEIENTVIGFLTDYVVAPGIDVEMINTTEVEGANLYKVAVNVSAMDRSQVATSYISKDGKLFFPEGISIDEFKEKVEQRKEAENRSRVPQQEQQNQTTIGNFIVSEDEICKEEDKPIIYYFGSSGCPSCKWEHPVIVNVTSSFEGYISLHDNMDSDADRDIFSKYSTGYIPTIVLGCKYYRVGAGASMGEEQESKVLTALICDLTGNKPVDVCSDPEIEALVAQLG